MRAAKFLAVVLFVVVGCTRSTPPGAAQPDAGSPGAKGLAPSRLRTGPVSLLQAPAEGRARGIPAASAFRPAPPAPPSRALRAGCSSAPVGMKVLVISSTASDIQLPAVTVALDYHTIPYTVWVIADHPAGTLTAAELATGCVGNYQGVILTVGNVVYSQLTTAELTALQAYEVDFGVRELNWYTYPGPNHGFANGAEGSGAVITGTLQAAATAPGAPFSYLKPGATISITNSWTYIGTPTDPAVVPLVRDSSQNVLVSTWATGGREIMTVTYDSNPNLLHDLVMAHGYVEWVTKGVYLGQYRAYLTPQVDDYFIEDDTYPVNADFCGTTANPTPCVCGGTLPACTFYRMFATDLATVVAWQDGVQAQAGNSGFRLAMAFNGLLAALTPGADGLTDATRDPQVQARFLWINHTYDHLNLGPTQDRPEVVVPPFTTTAATANEFTLNEAVATALGLSSYRSSRFVSPDVSGLSNPRALRALAQAGVRYAVTDTSIARWNNPKPNVGMYSAIQKNLYLVPRRATNLFFDASTREEWIGQYNALYSGQLGGVQTFDQILARESDNLLVYMLRGDIDPHMYHQSNLRQYDAVVSPGQILLGDLLDATITKFRSYSNLPIQSPDMDVAGERMKVTGERNAAGLTATFEPGVGVTLVSPVTTRAVVSRDAPVAGCPAGSESYATKCIATLSVSAGTPVTLAIP